MSRQPEAFGLDRLPTPIGTALLVSDADGVLRALDWEDHEPRMKDLLRLQYGAVVLKDARASAETRAALTGYFKGDLDRLNDIRWRHRRHAVPAQGLERAAQNSARRHHELRRIGGENRHAQSGARGRPRQRRQPAQRRRALPSPDRRQWFAGQIWRRTGAQAVAAGARGRGAERWRMRRNQSSSRGCARYAGVPKDAEPLARWSRASGSPALPTRYHEGL